MNVLISSFTLDLSGVPTYTLTLYNELRKRGHEVQVFSPQSGKLDTQMSTCVDINKIKKPDVIIGQHRDCVHTMRKAFPKIPMIFSAHGVEPDGEQPPNVVVEAYIAINEEVFSNLVLKGVPADNITIVRDFIDTERFHPTTVVNSTLKKVLFISNRKKWKTYAIIRKVCELSWLEFLAVGSPYGRSFSIEKDINDADLIVGSGRAILEAMSCGRPVIVFDKGVGDGYLTEDVYLNSRTHNFCGTMCEYSFNVADFTEEISKYKAEDGLVNRNIILQEHNVVYGVDKIMDVIGRL